MNKVPVGRSISHAYSFLFGRFFQIIGTAWLPALLYAVGYYFWAQNAPSWLAPLTQDRTLLINGAAATLGFFVLALVVRSVVGIALTQEALGIRNDFALAHFVLGPRELRLFFAQIRLILVIAILEIVVIAVAVLGVGAAAKYGATLLPAMPQLGGRSPVLVGALVLACVLYIWFFLTLLRLTFLLTAVASVEHQASVRRGYQLTRGSGWRILLVILGTALPFILVAGGVVYWLGGADLATAMQAAPGVARSHAMLRFYADHAMMMAILVGVATVIAGALMAGATATAYRETTGHQADEPEDDAALVAPLLAPVAGHDDHGHGGHDEPAGHDDHGLGGHDNHGGGHDDHGHGGHDDHVHGGGDHGHGDGHGGHQEHAGHDDHGHGGGDHGHGDDDDGDDDDEHDDHGHGDDDHGHGGHEDHGHGHSDHGHGHGDHGHADKAHGDHGHGHDDHGHGHGDGHHHHAKAA